jgi:hypothetical protein
MIEYRIATTEPERAALYRFRYRVYVEEMGRYRATADHVRGMLVDEEDERSWNFYAWDGRQVVASNRLTWGEHGFSARQIEQYQLTPFVAELPAATLVVGERTMVASEYRGTDLAIDFSNNMPLPIPIEQMLVTFGVCEPHLVSFYASLGQLPYADRNVSADEAGYLIPIISFPSGTDALVGRGNGPGLPACVQRVLDGRCAITSPAVVGDKAYWHALGEHLPLLQHRSGGLFEGLTAAEIRTCVERSNVIECGVGDRVVKRDGTARNVYVVLAGALTANDDETVRGHLEPGDVFGETAFVLECNRTLDVYATAPGTRILSLSDRVLRRLTADHSPLAAKLLRNVAKTVCRRAVVGTA